MGLWALVRWANSVTRVLLPTVTNVMLKMVDIILILELSSRLAAICGRCQALRLYAALRDPAGPALRRHAGIFVTFRIGIQADRLEAAGYGEGEEASRLTLASAVLCWSSEYCTGPCGCRWR